MANNTDKCVETLRKKCTDPKHLVGRLCRHTLIKTKLISGHMHFYFRDKFDQLIIIWKDGRLDRIAAKSPTCEEGECIKWSDSQFWNYSHGSVLRKLCDDISCIKIDDAGIDKTWATYDEFIRWLAESEAKQESY